MCPSLLYPGICQFILWSLLLSVQSSIHLTIFAFIHLSMLLFLHPSVVSGSNHSSFLLPTHPPNPSTRSHLPAILLLVCRIPRASHLIKYRHGTLPLSELFHTCSNVSLSPARPGVVRPGLTIPIQQVRGLKLRKINLPCVAWGGLAGRGSPMPSSPPVCIWLAFG